MSSCDNLGAGQRVRQLERNVGRADVVPGAIEVGLPVGEPGRIPAVPVLGVGGRRGAAGQGEHQRGQGERGDESSHDEPSLSRR